MVCVHEGATKVCARRGFIAAFIWKVHPALPLGMLTLTPEGGVRHEQSERKERGKGQEGKGRRMRKDKREVAPLGTK